MTMEAKTTSMKKKKTEWQLGVQIGATLQCNSTASIIPPLRRCRSFSRLSLLPVFLPPFLSSRHRAEN